MDTRAIRGSRQHECVVPVSQGMPIERWSVETLEPRRMLAAAPALSEARWDAVAIGVGSTALFAGGSTDSGLSDRIDLYDAKTGQWSIAQLPRPKTGLAAVTVGRKVLFAGAPYAYNADSTVDILDTRTRQWSTASLSEPRSRVAATAVGDTAIFAGADGTADVYHAATGLWSTMQLPDAQPSYYSTFAATTCGQALFINDTVADVYDSVTGRWSSAFFPSTGAVAAVVALGTKVYVAMNSYQQDTQDLAVYDGLTGQWTVLNTPVNGRLLQATAAGDRLLLYAEQHVTLQKTGVRVTVNEVVTYDVRTAKWTTQELPNYHEGVSAVTVGTRSIFAGGYTGYQSGAVAEVDVFSDPAPAPALDGTMGGKPGGAVTVSVRNGGDADLPAGAIVAVYASVDRTLHTDSMLLGNARLRRALRPGMSVQVSVATTLPADGLPTGGSVVATVGTARSLMQIATLGGVGSVPVSPPAAQWTSTVLALPPEGYDYPSAFIAVGTKALSVSQEGLNAYLYDSASNTVSSLTLPHAIGPDVAVVGDKVLFAGLSQGGPFYTGSTAVDIYDFATGQWSGATLSASRLEMTMVTVGHKAIFAGGSTFITPGGPGPASDVVDIYDADTGRWSTADLARHQYYGFLQRPLVLGDKVIFATRGLPRLDVYDTLSGQMAHVSLPAGLTSSPFGYPGIFSEVAVAGGMAVFSDGKTVAMYDPATGQWSTTTAPRTRIAGVVAAVGDLVAFAGGSLVGDDGQARETLSVDLYKVRTGQWAMTTLPTSITASAPLILGTKMIFVGQNLPFERSAGAIEIYDTATGEWSASPIDLSASVTIVGGKVLIGPSATDGNQHQIEVLAPTTAAPPTAPSPVPGKVIGGRGAFSWSAVDGATGYDVYVDESLVSSVATNKWRPATPIGRGSYTWRVTAKIGAASLAGPIWSFEV